MNADEEAGSYHQAPPSAQPLSDLIGGSDECGRSFHCGTDQSPVSYQLPVQLQIYINKSIVTQLQLWRADIHG